MTIKQLQDIVYAKFPNVGEVMATKFLEEGMRLFCQQTLVYRGSFDYVVGSSTRFPLDSDVLSVDSVYLRDVSQNVGTGDVVRKLVGEPLSAETTTTDPVYKIDGKYLLAGTLSDGLFVPFEATKKIVINCRTIPDSLSAGLAHYDEPDALVFNGDGTQSASIGFSEGSANVPGIPEQFHMAFAYHAMRVLSELSSDYPAAGYMNNRFAEFVRDGRKWASRKQDGNMQTIPYYY